MKFPAPRRGMRALVWAVLVLVLLSGGCAKKDDVLVLKLGHGLDIEHPVHRAMEYMAGRLAEKSQGAMRIEIFPGEQLGSEREMIELVQLGILDMVKTSTAPLESFVPIMSVFGVPYVFRSSDHCWNVLLGPIGKEILASGAPLGFRGLCYYDSGSRSFYTVSTPIMTPADLDGLKIRVQKSATAMEMVAALGGSPTPIDWGELYTSLQQGLVDGAENNPPSFYTSRHYEVCKFFSLDEHTRVPDIVLISEDVWQSMTDEQRRMLQEAAGESCAFQRKLWEEKTQEALDAVRAAGVQVDQPDPAPFQAKVKDMFDSYNGTEIGDLINKIQAVD